MQRTIRGHNYRSVITSLLVLTLFVVGCGSHAAALKSDATDTDQLTVAVLPDQLVCGPFPTMLPGPDPDPFITRAVFNTIEFTDLNRPGRTVVEETYTYFNPATKTLDRLKGEAPGPIFRYSQNNEQHFQVLARKLVDTRYNRRGIIPLPWNFLGATAEDRIDQTFDHLVAPLTARRLTNTQNGIANIVASHLPDNSDSALPADVLEYSYGFYQIRRDDSKPGVFRLRSGHTKTSMMAAERELKERMLGRRDYLDLPDANMTLQYGNTKAHFEVNCVAKGQTSATKNPLDRLAMSIHPAFAPQSSDYITEICRSRISRIVQLGLLRSSNQGLYDDLIPYFADPSQDPQKVLDAQATRMEHTAVSEGALPSGDGADGAASRLRVLETLEAENQRDYEQNPQACFAGSQGNLDKSRDSLERVFTGSND